VVYRSDVFAGIDEREFASEEVLGSGTRVFTVVNMMYSRPVDERFKSFVWNRLIKDERAGVAYAGQDFSSQDIYFIDALKAQEGKFTSNAELVESSGLGLFEQRLGEFLVKDRHRTHLEKFIKTADLYSTTMDQQIAQRRAALDQDEKKLQQAYEAIQPQLEAIRGRRERLPKIFEHYRKEAQRELKASFEQVMARLREDLPGELKGRPLPSIPKGVAGVLAQFQQKKILKEALEVCNGIVTERLSLWSKNPPDKPGAQQALAPLLERLFDEIQEEVAKIEREYTDVHFQLTGWTPPADAPTSLVSTQERVLSGIAGLFVGDFAAVLGAAGGGWRGVAGNVAAQAGAGLVVVMLGITGPLVIPAILVAGLVGNIVGGSLGLEERVKKKVLEKVQEELRNAPQNATAQVEQQTEALFGQIETETMREVMAVIQDEEQNIRQMVEMNKRGLADKAKSRTALDEAARKVAAQRQALKEVIVRVQQTA
jgi:hypothetical protein